MPQMLAVSALPAMANVVRSGWPVGSRGVPGALAPALSKLACAAQTRQHTLQAKLRARGVARASAARAAASIPQAAGAAGAAAGEARSGLLTLPTMLTLVRVAAVPVLLWGAVPRPNASTSGRRKC